MIFIKMSRIVVEFSRNEYTNGIVSAVRQDVQNCVMQARLQTHSSVQIVIGRDALAS